jgi:hypothetical protein
VRDCDRLSRQVVSFFVTLAVVLVAIGVYAYLKPAAADQVLCLFFWLFLLLR